MAFPTVHTVKQRHTTLESRRPPGVRAPHCPQLPKESKQSKLAWQQQPLGLLTRVESFAHC